MAPKDPKLPVTRGDENVEAFLREVAATPPPVRSTGTRGRLIFAMDATASREPTWDTACRIQSQMFAETAELGGLNIQLCYYRGFNELSATRWLVDAQSLASRMSGVRCMAGLTQISRLLSHARTEAQRTRVNALVFVGDCMEENIDKVCHQAAALGLLGVPVFVFQEGFDGIAERAFREMARLTRGAYCRFDANSARQLRDLLSAVAVYATGGPRALEDFNRRKGHTVLQLANQTTER